MITAVVQFSLPAPVSRERARELFLGTAPRYRGTAGLIRKYYLLSEDGSTAGGVYLWKSREDAERMYTAEWKQFVSKTYGAPPRLQYFETPVVVDNLAGTVSDDR
ncbi:MAG TPA: YdhR family protein [Usitatibacter sp.]|nr:YdhR family protein [Usitatibacter sp.]